MDAEECEQFTDVYWIKFRHVSNARFAKRKLDESVFLGNRLQVSYAPHFESLSDTKEKLEIRLKEVQPRLNSGKSRGIAVHKSQTNSVSQQMNLSKSGKLEYVQTSSIKMVSSDKVLFGYKVTYSLMLLLIRVFYLLLIRLSVFCLLINWYQCEL